MSNLELVAALLGAVSVWLTVRRIIWAFPIGIVMVVLYAWVFFEAKLYSDVLLQIAFAVMQVQGWIEWRRGDKASDQLIAVRSLSNAQWIWTGGIQLIGTLALGYGMDRFTDAALPYLDAFAAVQSILAQWWMNKRYLENWILWIAVDEVYLIIYSSRELYYTTALYAIFLLMAVGGYLQWRRKLAAEVA
jgi:nicotinamide mononucleotide transporter